MPTDESVNHTDAIANWSRILFETCTEEFVYKGIYIRMIHSKITLTLATYLLHKKCLKEILYRNLVQRLEESSSTYSIITTPSSARTRKEWHLMLCMDNCFPHPWGLHSSSNGYKTYSHCLLWQLWPACDFFKCYECSFADLTFDQARKFAVLELYPLTIPSSKD